MLWHITVNTNKNNHNQLEKKKQHFSPQKGSKSRMRQDYSTHKHLTRLFSFAKITFKYSHSADDTSPCQTSVFLVNNSLWEKGIAKCNRHIWLLWWQEAFEMVSEKQGHITRKAPLLCFIHNDKSHQISSKVMSRSDKGEDWARRVVATKIVAVIWIPRLMLWDS